MSTTLHDRPSKISSMRGGNPNSSGAVFNSSHAQKRRKTRKTSPPRNTGPSSLSKQIDLTKEDAELVSYSSTVADDSEDSLNLGTAERSRSRIAGDGRATQRLKADCGGGESSKAVDTDTETEAIEDFPVPTRKPAVVGGKGGVVRNMVRDYESNNGKSRAPKLNLNSSNPSNPLNPLSSGKPRLKVRFLFTEEEGWLADILIPRRSRTTPPSLSPRPLRMGRKAGGKMRMSYL
jgi:hypothetical protein